MLTLEVTNKTKFYPTQKSAEIGSKSSWLPTLLEFHSFGQFVRPYIIEYERK